MNSSRHNYYTNNLTAAVFTHSKPTQDQASKNYSIDGKGTQGLVTGTPAISI